MSKTFWAAIAVIVVIFGGLIAFNGHNKSNSQTASKASPTNHVEGSSPLGVKLVEYGDYQCPYCGLYFPTVLQVTQKYSDQVVFQFRNLPLSQLHQNAFAAARAAEAAGLQNKYWEMHDMLYRNQNVWASASNPNPTFEGYAAQLGLNVTQFKTDAASQKVNDTINADVNEFSKTKETVGTPAFFLNGKKITPDNTLDAFSKLIDAELAKQAKSKTTSP